MPDSYLQLRARVDDLGTAIVADNADRIACGAGCHECCVDGLTLVPVEAAVLGGELGLERERVHALIDVPPGADRGRCVLLDGDGRCTAYPARPIVCRTEGLPLSYPEPTGVIVCELNFRGAVPDRTSAFDMTNLEAALFAVNLEYCRLSGVDPLGRVAIDQLAEAAGIHPCPDE